MTSLFAGRTRGISSGPTAGPATPPPGRLRSGSPQQEAFWAELLGGGSNVILEARAGTGKSASCREGMWRLREARPESRSSYVAFNKAIADEFQAGLPPGAAATTMHSAGFAAIRAAIPGVGEPAKFKMYDIVDQLACFCRKARGRIVKGDQKRAKGALVRLAGLCKSHLSDGHDRPLLLRLCARHGIDLAGKEAILELVPSVLARCLEQCSVVDFTDMPWLPVMLGLPFPAVDFLFVDECQDLDPCQHALVRRMAGAGRLVAVGDPYQAIYAFRGADSSSMGTLGDQLAASGRGLVRLPLTMTRRCPRSHVELARRIVPEFEALPEAIEGLVIRGSDPDELLTPGVMALCRTNAPLVSACFRLAARGVPVAIAGRDLGDGLAKFVEEMEAATVKDLLAKVAAYRVAEVDRLSAVDGSEPEIEAVLDRCACLHAVTGRCDTPGQVVARIRSLFIEPTAANRQSMVILSSVHKAKGQEADRVAVLEPDLMPHRMATSAEDRQQELNLIYVAVTRSRRELSFCGDLPAPLRGQAPSAPATRVDDAACHRAPPPLPISELDRKRISYFKLNVRGA